MSHEPIVGRDWSPHELTMSLTAWVVEHQLLVGTNYKDYDVPSTDHSSFERDILIAESSHSHIHSFTQADFDELPWV